MVTEPPVPPGGATFGPVTLNGAGQDSGWTERGRAATVALRETWAGLAEACYELSDTEWALRPSAPVGTSRTSCRT